MTKNRYLRALGRCLRPLRREDRKRLRDYYEEIIDDRVEEGRPEADVLRELGAPKAVAAGILAGELAAGLKKRPSRGKIAWILALSPIWVSLLAAALAVCAAYFCVILALWAVSVGSAALAAYVLFAGKTTQATAYFGAALILTGLGILAWRGAKGIIRLAKKTVRARIGEEK